MALPGVVATSWNAARPSPLPAQSVKPALDKPPRFCKASRCKASPTEGDNMDLHEQAIGAASRVLIDAGMTTTDEVTMRLLTMAWLDGYKAGMVTVQGMANEAFSRVAEQFS